jgi:hypothetical protein
MDNGPKGLYSPALWPQGLAPPTPAGRFRPAYWHLRACVASAAASAGQVQASRHALAKYELFIRCRPR